MRAIFAAPAPPGGTNRRATPLPSTRSKIEVGLRQVTDAELWLLARVLGCPVADLLPRNARSVVPVLRQGEE